MNPGRHKLWFAFWGGVAVVVAALSWASLTVSSLEKGNAAARAENQRQEVVRLALWRMDSRLAPMIALEAARPIEDYDTLFAKENAQQADLPADDQIESNAYNLGFFEIDKIGKAKGSDQRARTIAGLTQIRSDESNDDSTMGFSGSSSTSASPDSISESDQSITPDSMVASAPEREGDFEARKQIANLAQSNRALSKLSSQENTDRTKANKAVLNDYSDSVTLESLRTEGMTDSTSRDYAGGIQAKPADAELRSRESGFNGIGAIEPRWVVAEEGEFELVLVRSIRRDGAMVVQGVWLDWDAISEELIGSIDDLLPASTLAPITTDPNRPEKGYQTPSYRLATIPVAFIPGGSVAVVGDSFTPAMIAMLVTWIAVVLAMVAVGLVLRTVLTLSARRGRFVGAVTHELRTPLTTFRLYSQMLADGMVTDESVRMEYLNTLKRESDRLTGIVENVLEYARISRQRGVKDKPKGEQKLTVGELMARIVPPMSRLGEQAGMDLIVSDETTDHAQRTATLDPHAVERIMMNLMDNACKYAGDHGDHGDDGDDGDSDLRVHLDARVSDDALLLVVADHGPGVPGRDRRKIFGEFVRGSSGTMRDRSGLGLGLALSRGLAIELGGDLMLVNRRGHGAEFELRIPLDGA
jgi:signal transduction histidine kinase